MCGISGLLHWGRIPDASARALKQAASQTHRGPDDEGLWNDQDVALSFRRLSIVDIAGGHQPMSDQSNRVTVVFNGEVYNHLAIRKTLEERGHRFKTDRSDTEVFVHGWIEWGEALFSKLNGMFAVAIWDKKLRTLTLARDRYGIKPLYVSNLPNFGIVFGSEVRSIHASGLVPREPEPANVREYLTFQNNWYGRTPFKNVEQVPPGSFWVCSETGRQERRYWEYSFNRNNRLDLRSAAEAHRSLLETAVARQLQADVPVTTYLSGGIDSTAITAVAKQRNKDVRAYSCIFELSNVGEDRIVDEREFSRDAAKFLDIARNELLVPQASLKTELDRTVSALEYPRMGMSYVNAMIARRVSEDAKVVLSGLGGDELHGGYVGRYQITPRLRSGSIIRRLYSRLRGNSPTDVFSNYRISLQAAIPGELHQEALNPNFFRNTKSFSAESQISHAFATAKYDDPWDVVMHIDATTYMHGLLVLEDKLSMAHSLETRVPLLDNELVDFASSLEWSNLCDGKTGKIVFRESVRSLLPESIVNKPKMGFGPPDASWYRGQLKSWISQRLSQEKIESVGILNYSFVEKSLRDHFSGRSNKVGLIWTLLSLQAWCEINEFKSEHFHR